MKKEKLFEDWLDRLNTDDVQDETPNDIEQSLEDENEEQIANGAFDINVKIPFYVNANYKDNDYLYDSFVALFKRNVVRKLYLSPWFDDVCVCWYGDFLHHHFYPLDQYQLFFERCIEKDEEHGLNLCIRFNVDRENIDMERVRKMILTLWNIREFMIKCSSYRVIMPQETIIINNLHSYEIDKGFIKVLQEKVYSVKKYLKYLKVYLNEFAGKTVRGADFSDYYEHGNYMNTGHEKYELSHNFLTDEDMKKTMIDFSHDPKHPDVYIPEGQTVHLRIYSWYNTPIHIKSDGTLAIHTQIAARNQYGINGNLGIERVDEDYHNDELIVVVEFLDVPVP